MFTLEKQKNIFRRFLLKALCLKIINIPLRFFAKLLSPILPKKFLSRIPIVGLIQIKLFSLPNKIYLHNDGNDHIASQLYWNGLDSYESETIKLFLELLKYSDTLFDIGANTGLYSIIAASVYPEKRIYAFEPIQEILKILNRNISLNKINNIKVIPQALAENEGIGKIYIPEMGGNIPTSASLLKDFRPSTKEIDLRTTTLDAFIQSHGITSVDLIKIDTEGTEHKIFQGAKNTFQQNQPIIICEVLKGLTEKFLMPILKSQGYLYFWITPEGLIQKKEIEGDPTYQNPNYLFITREKSESILQKINIRKYYLK